MGHCGPQRDGQVNIVEGHHRSACILVVPSGYEPMQGTSGWAPPVWLVVKRGTLLVWEVYSGGVPGVVGVGAGTRYDKYDSGSGCHAVASKAGHLRIDAGHFS